MRVPNNDCKYYDNELDCCKYFSDWTGAMPILQPCIDSPCAMCHRAEKKVATDTNVGGKWIPVTKRLPTEDDADADYAVLAIHKRSVKRYFHWKSVADNPFDFTYWMSLPESPEAERGDEVK